jgi:hypothetical protein
MKKESEKDFSEEHSLRRLFQNAAGWYVCVLVFLLPLKFGSLAVMPEAAGFFPGDLFSWVVINWPAHSFGIFSGAALLFSLAAYGVPAKCTVRGLAALLWIVGFAAAGLVGMVNSGAPFYAEGELAHLLGIASFCGAAALPLCSGSAALWRGRFFAALSFGVLLLCVNGLNQYFFGFDELREFLAKKQENGEAVHGVLLAKVADDRVYATMVSANVLAGFLLLAGPLAVTCFRRMGRRFEPERVSSALFFCVMFFPVAAVFLMTKTRAAFLCALVTAALYVLTLRGKRLLRIAFLFCVCAAVAGGAVYIRLAGRGFGSFAERADYMRTAARMFPEKPLTGHGWGEFFYRHMLEKTTDTDESTHDPHNVFLSFILQSGLPAGLLASSALLLPLILLWRSRGKNDAETTAVLWGGIAFSLHCCCDINMQIPACMAGAGLLLIAALPDGPVFEKTAVLTVKLALFLLLTAAGAGALFLNGRELRGDVAYTVLCDMVNTPPPNRPGEHLIVHQWQLTESLRKKHPFACNIMGDLYMAAGDLDTAERFFMESLRRDPRRPAVHERLAKIAEARGNSGLAASLRRRAHLLFPSHPGYKSNLINPPGKAILIE